jgi:hypothetical protein
MTPLYDSGQGGGGKNNVLIGDEKRVIKSGPDKYHFNRRYSLPL